MNDDIFERWNKFLKEEYNPDTDDIVDCPMCHGARKLYVYDDVSLKKEELGCWACHGAGSVMTSEAREITQSRDELRKIADEIKGRKADAQYNMDRADW